VTPGVDFLAGMQDTYSIVKPLHLLDGSLFDFKSIKAGGIKAESDIAFDD
jgi:hypothetical protein